MSAKSFQGWIMRDSIRAIARQFNAATIIRITFSIKRTALPSSA
jgi:hypothetical protein